VRQRARRDGLAGLDQHDAGPGRDELVRDEGARRPRPDHAHVMELRRPGGNRNCARGHFAYDDLAAPTRHSVAGAWTSDLPVNGGTHLPT
jgi:hypothetical protein